MSQRIDGYNLFVIQITKLDPEMLKRISDIPTNKQHYRCWTFCGDMHPLILLFKVLLNVKHKNAGVPPFALYEPSLPAKIYLYSATDLQHLNFWTTYKLITIIVLNLYIKIF